MKTRSYKTTLGLVTVTGLLALANPLQAATITAKGSDTLVILAQKWAEVYMRSHSGTKIQVTGGGSGTGFAALRMQGKTKWKSLMRVRL